MKKKRTDLKELVKKATVENSPSADPDPGGHNPDPEISITKHPVEPENKVDRSEEKIDNDKSKKTAGVKKAAARPGRKRARKKISKGAGKKARGQKAITGTSTNGEREKSRESKLDRILIRILPPWF
ncbi:hypothetical protein ES702_01740 [subsurface metagenome]